MTMLPPETPSHSSTPRLVEPIDPQITSIQPGGGACMRLELAWGYFRRFVLKVLFPGYVRRMADLREGSVAGCPHEVIDSRDLKFYRNLCDARWPIEHDHYRWRDRLPFARPGLAELMLFGGCSVIATVVAGILYWPVAIVPGVLAAFVFWFFRNPRRLVPDEPGMVVSPADGKVVSIETIAHDDFIGGPAIQIGIFLSVFNVHVNRMPTAVRVIGISYHRGKFLNALRPASARENEKLELRLEEAQLPYRPMIVRQIAGAIARRIVCWVRPGSELARGELFGMIKFGSRTELVLPQHEHLSVLVKVGDKVQGGATKMASYAPVNQSEKA